MDRLVHSTQVAVGSAGGRGRGVFATRALAPGDVAEEVVVLPISAAEAAGARAGGGVLEDYLFVWKEAVPEQAFAVATGFAPFYNHSPTPNVSVRRDFERGRISFVVLRAVTPGQELQFDYDCPLWFEVV